jgi:small subunit ribosomal protein S2
MKLKKLKFRVRPINKKINKKFIRRFPRLIFVIKHLIAANTHLGYEINRWNPEMKPILCGIRSNMHILNMQESILIFRRVFAFTTILIKLRKFILFSSENKNIDYILKKIILLEKQYISCNRWIGGIISNFKEIRNNIRILTTRYDTLMKYSLLSNRRKKLKLSLEGLIELYQLPALVIVLNGVKGKWVINEVSSKYIPCGAIFDSITTNQNLTFIMPGNVYGFATQILYIKLFQNVIRNARLIEIRTFIKTKSISKFLRKII